MLKFFFVFQSFKRTLVFSPENQKQHADKSMPDKHILDKSKSDKQVSDKSRSDKNISDKSKSDKHISDSSKSDKQVLENSKSGKQVSDKSRSDKQVTEKLKSDKSPQGMSIRRTPTKTHLSTTLSKTSPPTKMSTWDSNATNLSNKNPTTGLSLSNQVILFYTIRFFWGILITDLSRIKFMRLCLLLCF